MASTRKSTCARGVSVQGPTASIMRAISCLERATENKCVQTVSALRHNCVVGPYVVLVKLISLHQGLIIGLKTSLISFSNTQRNWLSGSGEIQSGAV